MSAKKVALHTGVVVVVASSGRRVPVEWAMAISTLSYPVGLHHAWLVSKKDPANPEMTRDKQRETLAERAIAMNARYMMCFDDDTIPPAHAIQSLFYVMEQNPNAAIVGGIYCTKDTIPEPIVFMELGGGSFWNWTLGDVFKCKGLGTGCMMIRLSALKTLPQPWFKETQNSTPGRVVQAGDVEIPLMHDSGTDDLHLCGLVDAAGFDIIAHGGVLPTHMDDEDRCFVLPEDSHPVQSYLKKKKEMEARGEDARNLEMALSDFSINAR